MPLFKCEKLEKINIQFTNISDISFLENNKNLKELILFPEENFIGTISKCENLEKLKTISGFYDISFLEKIKNLKELNFVGSDKIVDYYRISKCEKLEILTIIITIPDISFLEKNKNIKELHLEGRKLKNCSSVSVFENLEKLKIWRTNISDISFLEKNNSIKLLD